MTRQFCRGLYQGAPLSRLPAAMTLTPAPTSDSRNQCTASRNAFCRSWSSRRLFSRLIKHKREASRRLAGDLWRVYQALPQEHKTLVRLKALIDPTIGKAPFLEVVRKAGLRSKDGKAYIAASLSAELHALQAKELLDGALDCAPEIMHAVAVEACADKDAANLIDAVKAATPKSEREQVDRPSYRYLPPIDQDFALFRRFRLAIYANDEAEFVRLYKLVGAATSGPVGGKTLIQFLAGFPLGQRLA